MADIIHRLDFALRLIDTTSGRVVSGAGTRVRIDGGDAAHLLRDEGTYIFLNRGREDFDLEVTAPGYETHRSRVRYETLDKNLPLLELHMIPGARCVSRTALCTLQGTLAGLTALDAVRAGDSPCLIRAFDERKRILTIFNPHHLELGRVHYGVVDPDAGSYEAFAIEKRMTDQTCRIDRKLQRPFANHFPICPLVFGTAGAAGSYLLRVPDDRADARWYVRCTAGERVWYETVDFRAQPDAALRGPGEVV